MNDSLLLITAKQREAERGGLVAGTTRFSALVSTLSSMSIASFNDFASGFPQLKY